MNKLEIIWTKKALRQLKKIDHSETITNAVDKLAEWPNVTSVKNLVNMRGYRLTVKKYRVIFDVVEDRAIIHVLEVLKRNERTYKK